MKSCHFDQFRDIISQVREDLEKENSLLHGGFAQKLKDEERESIAIESQIAAADEEKGHVLNEIIEAEQQIMLWEKKIQLTKACYTEQWPFKLILTFVTGNQSYA